MDDLKSGVNTKTRFRKDGLILFNGKKFTSLSAAADHITRGSVDGWHFWEYERAPNDWVKLDKLRK